MIEFRWMSFPRRPYDVSFSHHRRFPISLFTRLIRLTHRCDDSMSAHLVDRWDKTWWRWETFNVEIKSMKKNQNQFSLLNNTREFATTWKLCEDDLICDSLIIMITSTAPRLKLAKILTVNEFIKLKTSIIQLRQAMREFYDGDTRKCVFKFPPVIVAGVRWLSLN